MSAPLTPVALTPKPGSSSRPFLLTVSLIAMRKENSVNSTCICVVNISLKQPTKKIISVIFSRANSVNFQQTHSEHGYIFEDG